MRAVHPASQGRCPHDGGENGAGSANGGSPAPSASVVGLPRYVFQRPISSRGSIESFISVPRNLSSAGRTVWAPTTYTMSASPRLNGSRNEVILLNREASLVPVSDGPQWDHESVSPLPAISAQSLTSKSNFPAILFEKDRKDSNGKVDPAMERGTNGAPSSKLSKSDIGLDAPSNISSKNNKICQHMLMPNGSWSREPATSNESRRASTITKLPSRSSRTFTSKVDGNGSDPGAGGSIVPVHSQKSELVNYKNVKTKNNKGPEAHRDLLLTSNNQSIKTKNNEEERNSSPKRPLYNSNSISRAGSPLACTSMPGDNNVEGTESNLPPNALRISTTTVTRTVRKVKYLPLDEVFVPSDDDEMPEDAIPPGLISSNGSPKRGVSRRGSSYSQTCETLSQPRMGSHLTSLSDPGGKASRDSSKSMSSLITSGLSAGSILGSYKWARRLPASRGCLPSLDLHPSPASTSSRRAGSNDTSEPQFLLQQHQQRLVIGGQKCGWSSCDDRYSVSDGTEPRPYTLIQADMRKSDESLANESRRTQKKAACAPDNMTLSSTNMELSNTGCIGLGGRRDSLSMHSNASCATVTQAISVDDMSRSPLGVVLVKKTGKSFSQSDSNEGCTKGCGEYEEEEEEEYDDEDCDTGSPMFRYPASPTLTIAATKRVDADFNLNLDSGKDTASNESRERAN